MVSAASPARGWERLYVEHVQQAQLGADLDFLVVKADLGQMSRLIAGAKPLRHGSSDDIS
jgi:hypothetical protein